jgi:serine kinase of HPr protein (carbohydrate metabolism regulator)
MKAARELVHGTCVALGTKAALLRGGSGAGKSDLALRFLSLPPEPGLETSLVADDQVVIEAREGRLVASPPATLAGKLEVRGLGIVPLPHLDEAALVLVADLVEPGNVPRMPPETAETANIAGVPVPLLRLAPFEASAPLKLKLALLSAAPQLPI